MKKYTIVLTLVLAITLSYNTVNAMENSTELCGIKRAAESDMELEEDRPTKMSKTEESSCTFADIHRDVMLYEIFSLLIKQAEKYTDAYGIMQNLSLVNKSLQELVEHDAVDKQLCQRVLDDCSRTIETYRTTKNIVLAPGATDVDYIIRSHNTELLEWYLFAATTLELKNLLLNETKTVVQLLNIIAMMNNLPVSPWIELPSSTSIECEQLCLLVKYNAVNVAKILDSLKDVDLIRTLLETGPAGVQNIITGHIRYEKFCELYQ